MTYYVAVKLIEEMSIDPNNMYFTVSHNAASLKGTTAGLCENDRVCVMDLLYGMMVASGNDAAQSIAENMGRVYEEFLVKGN
jgi:D-alanyl-D-alanine carboxypeptidase (penicillin-binding protein 5/6)